MLKYIQEPAFYHEHVYRKCRLLGYNGPATFQQVREYAFKHFQPEDWQFTSPTIAAQLISVAPTLKGPLVVALAQFGNLSVEALVQALMGKVESQPEPPYVLYTPDKVFIVRQDLGYSLAADGLYSLHPKTNEWEVATTKLEHTSYIMPVLQNPVKIVSPLLSSNYIDTQRDLRAFLRLVRAVSPFKRQTGPLTVDADYIISGGFGVYGANLVEIHHFQLQKTSYSQEDLETIFLKTIEDCIPEIVAGIYDNVCSILQPKFPQLTADFVKAYIKRV
jgi:hypothetical protein